MRLLSRSSDTSLRWLLAGLMALAVAVPIVVVVGPVVRSFWLDCSGAADQVLVRVQRELPLKMPHLRAGEDAEAIACPDETPQLLI